MPSNQHLHLIRSLYNLHPRTHSFFLYNRHNLNKEDRNQNGFLHHNTGRDGREQSHATARLLPSPAAHSVLSASPAPEMTWLKHPCPKITPALTKTTKCERQWTNMKSRLVIHSAYWRDFFVSVILSQWGGLNLVGSNHVTQEVGQRKCTALWRRMEEESVAMTCGG